MPGSRGRVRAWMTTEEDHTDAQLLQTVATGGRRARERAMSVLYDRHKGDLFALILKTLFDRGEAEHALQETFLRIYITAGRFREGAPFRPWAYRIATNITLDAIRKSGRTLTGPSLEEYLAKGAEKELHRMSSGAETFGYPESIIDAGFSPDVEEFLQALPPEVRLGVILLAYDVPNHEIAAYLRIAPGTWANALTSARHIAAEYDLRTSKETP